MNHLNKESCGSSLFLWNTSLDNSDLVDVLFLIRVMPLQDEDQDDDDTSDSDDDEDDDDDDMDTDPLIEELANNDDAEDGGGPTSPTDEEVENV